MRYEKTEVPIAVGILPPTAQVEVKVVRIDNDTAMQLSSNAAQESVVEPGVYRFPFSNIQDPIDGFVQVVVVFTHIPTGEKDYAKIMLRGVMDDISRTRRLVGALL